MEFIAGMVFAVFVGFIGRKIYDARQRKMDREDTYIPPRGSGLDREHKMQREQK